jgi:hypothetical protein
MLDRCRGFNGDWMNDPKMVIIGASPAGEDCYRDSAGQPTVQIGYPVPEPGKLVAASWSKVNLVFPRIEAEVLREESNPHAVASSG